LTSGGGPLAGRLILVVEDDFIIADLMAMELKANGAEIVGPARTVKDALTLIRASGRIDGAVLDVNLRHELVYPVAKALQTKSVRIVFTTGYNDDSIAPDFADVPCLQKPVTIERLIQALFG